MSSKQEQEGARCIGIVGPYGSGKTSLLEAILFRNGAINRLGRVEDKNTVGDGSPEARKLGFGTELNVATTEYLGEFFTFLDCPGNIELSYEGTSALTACDVAIVVVEPDVRKIPALQLILKELEERGIPHFLFINKIDKRDIHIRQLLKKLQTASSVPLVLREIPIRDGEKITGFIDLALERAYIFEDGKNSRIEEIPPNLSEDEENSRFSMLEKLADFDDDLLEMLLEDIDPAQDKVFEDLKQELRDGAICPVFIGSATNSQGITRLLKSIRHDAPRVEETAEDLEVLDRENCAQIIKTLYSRQGKLSFARVLRGRFNEESKVYGKDGKRHKIAGVFAVDGQNYSKINAAETGQTVAFARLDEIDTGDTVATRLPNEQIEQAPPPLPVFGNHIEAKNAADDVKLSSALVRLMEEMPSLSVNHDTGSGEQILWGQGEIQLRIAEAKLQQETGVEIKLSPRAIAFRETIQASTLIREKYKKQSGGHGQYAEVELEIKPLARGEGFQFGQSIAGGAIPAKYIPAVEHGVMEALKKGPKGFPVEDLEVHLKDGGFHTVDSSEQSFRIAGELATIKGLQQCSPVLLEPVMLLDISCPSEATPRINSIISSRRGHILGYDLKHGWEGWDVIQAQIPDIMLQDLIIEIRSATQGVGSFAWAFDHLAELHDDLAKQVLSNSEAA